MGNSITGPEDHLPIALLGAGAMGGAMLRGWIGAGLVGQGSVVIDPAPPDDLAQQCKNAGITLTDQPPSTLPDLVFVAIKPQIADQVLAHYRALPAECTFVSVMAGLKLDRVQEFLGGMPRPLVRAMPNLGSALGAGATGLYANNLVPDNMREQIDRLMSAIGESVWVPDEAQIDFVTAISGSGPAYFFLLTEALEEAGIDIGLTPDAAATLARATAYGAGSLLHKDPQSSAALRKAVTSPGGTTAAALEKMDNDHGMRQLVTKGVKAAVARAHLLNKK